MLSGCGISYADSKGCVCPTNDEIVSALDMAVKMLAPDPGITTLEYRSPSAELRREADRIDKREADYYYIKNVLDRAKRCR
jgi:hypothetical protein